MRPKVAAESCSLPELVPKKKQIHPPPLEVDPRARAALDRLSRKPAPQQRVPVTPAARPADDCCCDPPSGDAGGNRRSELQNCRKQLPMRYTQLTRARREQCSLKKLFSEFKKSTDAIIEEAIPSCEGYVAVPRDTMVALHASTRSLSHTFELPFDEATWLDQLPSMLEVVRTRGDLGGAFVKKRRRRAMKEQCGRRSDDWHRVFAERAHRQSSPLGKAGASARSDAFYDGFTPFTLQVRRQRSDNKEDSVAA